MDLLPPAGDRALRRLVEAGGVLSGLREARLAAELLLGAPAEPWAAELAAVIDASDQLAVIGAVHAMAGLDGSAADERLASLLDDDRPFVVEHAAWALSARRPHRPAMIPLAGIVGAATGFEAMLAQRTLEGWAATDAAAVAAATCRLLEVVDDDTGRARLVETLGLTSRRAPWRLLERIAADEAEGLPARVAAVAALGDHPGDSTVLLALTTATDELAEHAVLALHDRRLRDRRPPPPSGHGIGVGQVFVHTAFGADDRVGAGDQGGITTLLRLLANELSALADVGDVVSIGSGGVVDALLSGMPRSAPGPSTAAVPFGPPGGVDLRDAWCYRVQIERGLRRILRSLPGLDILHLRMADVGTLAAARVARRAGMPIVFTAAPDPHGVIAAMEDEGTLSRDRFGDSDMTEHWWFRVRMVERLIAQAEHVVLLPRPGGPAALGRLLDADDLVGRSTVVPEGVHAAGITRARARVAQRRLTELGSTVDDLCAALSQLPRRRRRLPLVVSVGRLHPAKGMARVVAAWRTTLARSTNLVIIGGDLEAPSAAERAELDAIGRIATQRDGLILLGQRSHEDVATLLHVAAGRSSPPFPCGVYVAGARKEEFGLAIVEAMAAGLPVVAPAAGGPSTYVRDGVDGILVHGAATSALADGMRRALQLADVPGRAAATSARVAEELTIERMATRLGDIYVAAAASAVVRS